MPPLAPTQAHQRGDPSRTFPSVAVHDFSSIKEEVSNEKLVTKSSDLESNTGPNGIDEATQKRLLRRVDLQILPIALSMNVFSFLDRVSIGNARLMGLEEDLGLVDNQYQIAVSVLFITYCLSEVPANMLLKKLGPHRFLPAITVAWGIVATCTGAVQNFAGLLAIRLLMGLFESGLLVGLIAYFTMFYRRTELGTRLAGLIITTAVAGAVGGLLAYGIEYMDGVAGLQAWRWLFILEGSPSILLAIAAFFILPESPEKAIFLSHDDRELLLKLRCSEIGQTRESQEFRWADVKAGFKDWQIWVFSLQAFMTGIMFYGFAIFLPTIVESFGTWTRPQANALTVPIYVLGCIVYFFVIRISDRMQQRGLITAGFVLFVIAGYAMLLADAGSIVSYAALFVLSIGLYPTIGIPLAWGPGNKPRFGKRAFTAAVNGMAANIAGACMPFIFQTTDAPKYTSAYAVSLAMVAGAGIIFVFMSMYYRAKNKRRDEGKEDYKLIGKTEEEIEAMGDDSPSYRYTP